MSTGYSGTPLRQKLGVKPDETTWRLAMPDVIADEIGSDAPPQLVAEPIPGLASAHLFVTEAARLVATLARLRLLLDCAGMV